INSCHPIPPGSGRRNEQRSIMTIGRGAANKYLSGDDLRQIVTQAFESHKLEGKRVIILIPDGTRTMPMPQMFALFQQILRPRVKALDYLVALGTHPIMGDQQLSKLVGHQVVNGKCGDTNVFNHHWEDPATFANLGTIPAAEIAKITSDRMSQDVPVTLNKLILDYDQIIICGPVFPHEVVGFSGGNKYLFPGVSGPEVLNFFHWLGAVVTNPMIIGNKWTPVRKVVDRVGAMVSVPKLCLCMVVDHAQLAGLFIGSPEGAWDQASELSKKLHIEYKDHPFHTVLSCAPKMYDELWVGGKCMYKLEPVVADGGEVISYATHIHESS